MCRQLLKILNYLKKVQSPSRLNVMQIKTPLVNDMKEIFFAIQCTTMNKRCAINAIQDYEKEKLCQIWIQWIKTESCYYCKHYLRTIAKKTIVLGIFLVDHVECLWEETSKSWASLLCKSLTFKLVLRVAKCIFS